MLRGPTGFIGTVIESQHDDGRESPHITFLKTADLTPEERAERAAYLREWRKKNPDKQPQYARTTYLRNPQAQREAQERYYEKYPEKRLEHEAQRRQTTKDRGYAARYRDKLKVLVLTHYGGGKMACVQCGFDHPDALCLDHINDDGKAHRAVIGQNIYRRLKVQGFPPGLQTLCQNCNWVKETARRRASRNNGDGKPLRSYKKATSD